MPRMMLQRSTAVGCMRRLASLLPQSVCLCCDRVQLPGFEAYLSVDAPRIRAAERRVESDSQGHVPLPVVAHLKSTFTFKRFPHLRPGPSSPIPCRLRQQSLDAARVGMGRHVEDSGMILCYHRNAELVPTNVCELKSRVRSGRGDSHSGSLANVAAHPRPLTCHTGGRRVQPHVGPLFGVPL